MSNGVDANAFLDGIQEGLDASYKLKSQKLERDRAILEEQMVKSRLQSEELRRQGLKNDLDWQNFIIPFKERKAQRKEAEDIADKPMDEAKRKAATSQAKAGELKGALEQALYREQLEDKTKWVKQQTDNLASETKIRKHRARRMELDNLITEDKRHGGLLATSIRVISRLSAPRKRTKNEKGDWVVHQSDYDERMTLLAWAQSHPNKFIADQFKDLGVDDFKGSKGAQRVEDLVQATANDPALDHIRIPHILSERGITPKGSIKKHTDNDLTRDLLGLVARQLDAPLPEKEKTDKMFAPDPNTQAVADTVTKLKKKFKVEDQKNAEDRPKEVLMKRVGRGMRNPKLTLDAENPEHVNLAKVYYRMAKVKLGKEKKPTTAEAVRAEAKRLAANDNITIN